MTFSPDPKQTLLLLDLIGRGGAGLLGAVAADAKPAVRNALKAAGFLTEEKIGRAAWLDVSEKGWAWAGAHLDAPLPTARTAAGAPPKTPTLQLWLAATKAYLDAEGVPLVEFLAHLPAPKRPDPPAKTARKTRAKTKASPATIETRIRQVVRKLVGIPAQDGVRLSVLRAHLADVPHTDVDKALASMFGKTGVEFQALDNPRDIDVEKASAFTHARQTFHVVWITK